MLRRLFITLAVLASVLVLAAATLPWWWGAVLRWQGAKHGLQFSKYEKIGYARWALHDLRVAQPGWSVAVDRLEAAHPWRLWRSLAQTEVRADGVVVTLPATAGEEERDAPGMGPRELYDRVRTLAPELPELHVVGVEIAGWREAPIRVAQVEWRDQRVAMKGLTYEQWTGDLVAGVVAGTPGQLSVALESVNSDWRLELTAPIDELSARMEGHWREQPMRGRLTWADDAWRPTWVELNLPEWRLAAEELGLPPGYAQITGTTFARWEQDAFTASTSWQGEPRPDSGYSPIEIRAEATGNERATRIETLTVDLPGLALVLDQPLQLNHQALEKETVSEFSMRADLGVFPWVEGEGTVSGALQVRSAGLGWPEIGYDLSTEDVSWRALAGLSGGAAGSVSWPRWHIEWAAFTDAAGNQITVSGRGEAAEIASAEWSADVQGAFLARWLEDRVGFDRVVLKGQLSGVWPQLNHAGELASEAVQLPGLRPLGLSGSWQGQGWSAAGAARLQVPGSRLMLEFEGDAEAVAVQAELERGETSVWRMSEPMRIEFTDEPVVKNLRLEGAGMTLASEKISVESGGIDFGLQQPDWSWLTDWWEHPPEIPVIRSAEGVLKWESDRLFGRLSFDGDLPVGKAQLLGVAVTAESTGDSLQVESGAISWEGAPFAQVRGRVPIALSLSPPYWRVDEAGVVDAALQLKENLAVWEALNAHTQIDVRNPRLEVDIAGTWRQPRGEGYLGIDQIVFSAEAGSDSPWPVVSEIEAKLVDDGTGLVVDPLTAKVDGQVITFQGELPFTPEEWSRLSADPMAFFRDEGRGRIKIPRAELAAFAKFLPAYLVPTGELEVDLSYAPEAGTNGRIQLQNAVSKPLGPLGVLQEINADLQFENRRMEISRVAALMGGQPLTISGAAGWPPGGSVELNLSLRGNNLPIVRTTGVLLRSDLELRIESDASGAGRVSGEARLRDGLVLVDVRSLVPRGGAAVTVPARRPPYFSITVPPLNSWDLDVRLRGEDFLRLRTPVITGAGSLRARLEGTLESPLLRGEMELREAVLRLPFARLDVDEALVRLTEADPYDPEIWLEANGQRLGYDLRLELEGKASEPQLTLQSSPSLTAEQVLMLVMAGVTPTDETDLVNSDRAVRLGMYFGQGVLGDLFGTDERERLSVSTGEKLSRLGKETYEFEYEIADRWSVVGEYDEFDYYNAAVKWRVRPGKPKDPTLDSDPDEDGEEDDHE